jgi:hypothetical protein
MSSLKGVLVGRQAQKIRKITKRTKAKEKANKNKATRMMMPKYLICSSKG